MKPGQTHAPSHPRPISTLIGDDSMDFDDTPDIEPDIRYRMVSEAAYHRYLDRGCVEGYDVDDWLAAEADVERELRAAGNVGVE